MNSTTKEQNQNEFYSLTFNDKVYNVNFERVDKLLEISKYKGLEIKLTFKLNRDIEVTGLIIDFESIHKLVPFDEFIPLVFKLKTQNGIVEINFTEIIDFIQMKE